jgi:putative phosphoserine phosphatase/1-acylglycerol-3-phosphate O-acyltransferase
VLKVPVLGVELQRLLFLASPPVLWPYARFDVAGTEHVPRTGPAILVGNHRSYFDVPAMIQMMRRTGRTGRILAKRELFDVPVVGALATALGGIPVDRASGGQESFEHAAVALEGGELVCLLPQGTIPRGAKFYDPVLKGRTGAARLAAMTGAPVIPFGVWGTEDVWPRSEPVPRMFNLTDPPRVRVRVGPPVELKLRSAAADTRRIMTAITDCLPPEAREHREPTAEEIRLATPAK